MITAVNDNLPPWPPVDCLLFFKERFFGSLLQSLHYCRCDVAVHPHTKNTSLCAVLVSSRFFSNMLSSLTLVIVVVQPQAIDQLIDLSLYALLSIDRSIDHFILSF